MRTVFHHRGVWSKIWNIRGHLGCHTAICKIITLDAPYIGTITRNVTRATSLTLERRSCVNKYEISSSSRIWKHLTFKIFEQQEESPGRPNICLAHEEGWYTPEMAICRGMCHPKVRDFEPFWSEIRYGLFISKWIRTFIFKYYLIKICLL